MPTLEKNMNYLYAMPDETIEQVLNNLVGAVSDDGKSLEEYRGERRKERYGLED